ncbi:MAG: radical SAM protein [Pseudomonadota bacterium]
MGNVKKKKLDYIFGPVPSRRLGFSLGVDIVPFKTCTLDCVYCQLGRTAMKTVKRERYATPKDIVDELSCVLDQGQKVDYITLSGSGEPTLNSNIGDIIESIKATVNTPVAVITNGTLLYQERVRNTLYRADLLIPSLDAATQEVFERINRPHHSLNVEKITEGLKTFSREFRGEMWLEIMLVKGFNDHLDEVEKIKAAVSEINPQQIQLNTVVRPPAENCAEELSAEELHKVKSILGEKCSIIGQFKNRKQKTVKMSMKSAIVDLTKRRSVTLSDISNSLGISWPDARKYLKELQEEEVIRAVVRGGQNYYRQMDESHNDKLSKSLGK